MRKHLIWIAPLAAVLALAGWFVYRRSASPAPDPGQSRTAEAQVGSIAVWVSGTGQVEPAAQAGLSFATTGIVGEVEVEIGQRVSQGDVLMALDRNSLDAGLISAEADLISAQQQLDVLLDPLNVQLELAQAQAELAQARDALKDAEYLLRVRQPGNRGSDETIDAAEARLLLAQNEYDRAKAAYDNLSGRAEDDPARAVALTNLEAARQSRDSALRTLNWYKGHPSEIEQAMLEADVAVAQANVDAAEERVATLSHGPDPDEVEAARARLRAAQARVDQARLTAPFDGTILAVNYSPGDGVVPGETAIVIADLSSLHIQTSVDELDIASVQVGQAVEISLDALPELSLQGQVDAIGLAPVSGATTTEYPVRVALPASHERTRVGLTAALNILVAEKDDVLLIPNWALRFDSETGEVFVLVRRASGLVRQEIELGLRNEAFSEILSGLQPGDLVAAAVSTPEPGRGPGFFGGGD